MKISDLNHLETISEAPNVLGGLSYRDFFSIWVQRWYTKHSAVSITGQLENGTTFAFASASASSNSEASAYASASSSSKYGASAYASASSSSKYGASAYAISLSQSGSQDWLEE